MYGVLFLVRNEWLVRKIFIIVLALVQIMFPGSSDNGGASWRHAPATETLRCTTKGSTILMPTTAAPAAGTRLLGAK